jgi:hypothetical protein
VVANFVLARAESYTRFGVDISPVTVAMRSLAALHTVYKYYSGNKVLDDCSLGFGKYKRILQKKKATELRLNRERDIVGTVNCVAKSQQGGDDACGVHIRATRKVAQLTALAVSGAFFHEGCSDF